MRPESTTPCWTASGSIPFNQNRILRSIINGSRIDLLGGMGPLPFDRPLERFCLGEELAVIELAAYTGAVHNEVLLQVGGPAQMLGEAILRHHEDFAAPPGDLPDPSDPLCLRQELRLGDIVDPTGCALV